jgi:glycosyltransferase involved in cell wall biosynthesis
MNTNKPPKMLKVETGYLERTFQYFPTDEFIDYRVYDRVPKWWRRIEQLLRLDIYLAYRTKRIADQYDIIWANSEKVAVPLSFLNIKKPMVVILQNPESPLRMLLIRLTGIARKWAGIGVVSNESGKLLQAEFGVKPDRIFQYFAARTDLFQPADHEYPVDQSRILSIGVAKRDYDTMIAALSELPGYQTEIFVSSKYGDQYTGGQINKVADWIRFPGRLTDEELRCRYQQARFVVVPLKPTSHTGAGVTSVFEASASGKAVIATDTGGMNSYVVDGKTGLLVPPADVQALRNAIRKLWENPKLALEMGRAGREFVKKNYSQQGVVELTTRFLRNLILTSNQPDH